MLHVPKVVQVPHELNGLHSEKRKVRFNRKSHERTERANGVLTLADGLVVVAGLVRDAMFVSVLPHPAVVSPLTGARLRAVDHVLDRNVSRWPRSFPLYVDAIYEAEKFPKKCNFCLEKAQHKLKGFYIRRFPSVLHSQNVICILFLGNGHIPPSSVQTIKSGELALHILASI